jgi:hypothetical protein
MDKILDQRSPSAYIELRKFYTVLQDGGGQLDLALPRVVTCEPDISLGKLSCSIWKQASIMASTWSAHASGSSRNSSDRFRALSKVLPRSSMLLKRGGLFRFLAELE